MARWPSRVLRLGIATACLLATSLWFAGCAGPFGFAGIDGRAAPFRDPGWSMQAAVAAVVLGTSGKDDVLAALGPAAVIRFDSGYEVWVYRSNPLKSDPATAEFVILFAPSGIVKKIRIRLAYGGGQEWPD